MSSEIRIQLSRLVLGIVGIFLFTTSIGASGTLWAEGMVLAQPTYPPGSDPPLPAATEPASATTDPHAGDFSPTDPPPPVQPGPTYILVDLEAALA